jgi:3-hydroxybutyryl-CoA dehydrogenase
MAIDVQRVRARLGKEVVVGLDVRLAIAEHLTRELGERFRAPQLLRRLVRAGKLGKKSGEGFYKY